jgi:hypothetical protein
MAFAVARAGDQLSSYRKVRVTLQYPSRGVTVAFAYSRGMVLIMIFCPGEINRGSGKDGSDYNQSRP